MEFMLSEALPIYSGGLGNVAGDQLKATSDLGVPVVGVGLLYQQGYFRQVIDKDGAQEALFPYNDPGHPSSPSDHQRALWWWPGAAPQTGAAARDRRLATASRARNPASGMSPERRDNRRRTDRAAQVLEHAETAAPWQPDVRHDQIESVVEDQNSRAQGPGISHRVNDRVMMAKVLDEERQHVGIVFRDENAPGGGGGALTHDEVRLQALHRRWKPQRSPC